MFGIGGFELFLILIFGFLIFGPDKLPEIAKTVGKAIAKFRGAQESMNEKLKDVSFVDKESDSPLKNPMDVLSDAASDVKKGMEEASSEKGPENSARGNDDVKDGDAPKRQEGFAERKARYDRERALRKKVEAKAEEESKAADAAKAKAEKEAADNPRIDVGVKLVAEEGD